MLKNLQGFFLIPANPENQRQFEESTTKRPVVPLNVRERLQITPKDQEFRTKDQSLSPLRIELRKCRIGRVAKRQKNFESLALEITKNTQSLVVQQFLHSSGE